MQDYCALKAVEFSKYRVFEQRQRLELKPLTLLFGHNSAGKSAALRLLPILAAAAQRQRRNANLAVLVKRHSKGTPDRRRRGTPLSDMMQVC
jgi:predicted ATPase